MFGQSPVFAYLHFLKSIYASGSPPPPETLVRMHGFCISKTLFYLESLQQGHLRVMLLCGAIHIHAHRTADVVSCRGLSGALCGLFVRKIY